MKKSNLLAFFFFFIMVQVTLHQSIECKQETTESVNIPMLMITQRRKTILSLSHAGLNLSGRKPIDIDFC
jgi:hypothetical protein